MTTKILIDICELTGKPCRHVSIEIQYRPYTEIKLDNGIYKPISQGKQRCEIGQICNSRELGKNPWISEMHYCPILWSTLRYGKIPTGEKKARKKIPPIKAKIIK